MRLPDAPRRSSAPLALTAALCSGLTACYDTDPASLAGSGSGAGAGPAKTLGPALYRDANSDGAVGPGDTLTLRFDREVTTLGSELLGISLPVAENSFGNRATLTESTASTQVTIELGLEGELRTRGSGDLGVVALGAPSLLTLDPAARIAGADGDPVSPATLDITPLHAPRPEPLVVAAGVRSALVADLDGDGALELIQAGSGPAGGLLTAWRLEADASWTLLGDLPHSSELRSLLAIDLDRDGRTEVVCGAAGIDRIARLGLGGLSWVQDLPGSSPTESIEAVDLDRDGTLELLLGRSDGLWLVTEAMGDSAPEQLAAEPVLAVAAGDLDLDGHPDVLVAHADRIESLRGDCDGLLAPWGQVPTGSVTDLALADADGDGVLDLAAAGPWGLRVHSPGHLVGAGLSEIQALGPQRMTWWDDHDGDGRPALFGWGLPTPGSEADALSGWESPLEGPAIPLTAHAAEAGAPAALADLDRDGDLDLLVLETEPLSLRGSLAGTHGDWILEEVTAPNITASAAACAADLDLDGDEDVVLAQLGTVSVWLNEAGALALALELDTGANRVEDIEAADLNGDGRLDILTVGTVHGLEVFLADGAGGYTGPSPLVPATAPANDVELGDLDGDGDLDVVLGTLRGQPDLVLENVVTLAGDGAPGGDTVPPCTWVGLQVRQELSTKMTHDLALDDVDADGDLDVVFGHGVGELSASWRNDGAGNLTPFELFPDFWATEAVLFADVWGDAGRDLLLFGEDTTLLRRNQGGSFPSGTANSVQLPRAHTTAAALADLNGDGHLDLVTVHDFGLPTRAWFGPWPEFTGPPDRVLPALDMHQVLLSDLDGDGAEELLVTSEIEGVPARLFQAR